MSLNGPDETSASDHRQIGEVNDVKSDPEPLPPQTADDFLG
jgi:hypothetical protein